MAGVVNREPWWRCGRDEDSSSEKSSNDEISLRKSRKGREPTPLLRHEHDSDSEGREWLDTTSKSDDSSSDSELDIRDSQRKAYQRKKAAKKSMRHSKPYRGRHRRSRSASPLPRRKLAKCKTRERDERSRSRSPVGRDHSRSPVRDCSTRGNQGDKSEAGSASEVDEMTTDIATLAASSSSVQSPSLTSSSSSASDARLEILVWVSD